MSEFNSTSQLVNRFMLTKYPFESLVTLSEMGRDVSRDRCCQQTSEQRQQLTSEQIADCQCYGEKLFKQCNFPGISGVKRTSNFQLDMLKARSFIGSIHSNYGSMFEVDLLRHGFSMILLIGGILLLLFVA